MHVTQLEARDFRSHARVELTLDAGITVLAGPVGAGKTNLLEAVHVGCAGRSFRTANERELLRFGQRSARVRLGFAMPDGTHTSEVVLQTGAPKTILLDGARVTHPRARAPGVFVCVFAPDHLELVKGPAGGRRARLDEIVVTMWPARRATRAEYARALAQRNALIGRVRAGAAARDTLQAWDRQLAQHGVELMSHRRELVELLQPLFSARAIELGLPPAATVRYRPRSAAEAAIDLERELAERVQSDLDRGFTLHGPHRDELQIEAAGRDLRRYGSQGQQRLALLALLLAERDLLCESRGNAPLMLLDDVLSELDPARRERLLGSLAEHGQVLVTTADVGSLPAGVDPAVVYVEPGAEERGSTDERKIA